MKKIGFCCLHYGKPYLYYSIKSVIDSVDEFHVIYSPVGSHGARSDLSCPDTRDELYDLAESAAGDKLRWSSGIFQHEGFHREHIYNVAPDADIIVVVDFDEIYPEGLIEEVVPEVIERGIGKCRLRMVHFYRSFKWAILKDMAFPHRIINTHEDPAKEWTAGSKPICHLGYSIPVSLLQYKISIHGHRAEIHPDYVSEVYAKNRRTLCHPCGNENWNAEEVNPEDYFPVELMRSHPYWGLDLIE